MTRTITALRIQKRNKERVNVFLDGEYAFALNLNTTLGLRRGQPLSRADIASLQSQDEAHRAYQLGLRLLGFRPRSQAEIERHLHRKGFAAQAITATIERLLAKHYLDDEAFARYWLEHRERIRPRGSLALRHELRLKGVDTDIINSVLTELDEEASAWAALERKLERWRRLDRVTFRKRAMGFLSQRGFHYGTVRTVCDRAWQAIADSDSQAL